MDDFSNVFNKYKLVGVSNYGKLALDLRVLENYNVKGMISI